MTLGNPIQMQLLKEWGGFGDEAAAAIGVRLRKGCWCGHEWAVLTRRVNASGALNVVLQCDHCGNAVGGALKREHHPRHRDYPEWDEAKREDWNRSAQEDAQRRLAEYRRQAEQRMAARVAGKEEFYASNAWRWMRSKVMQRADGVCEACGHRQADTVHHTTYRFGLKAPLYTLRALCDHCHKRMHTHGDGWHDPELPAHYSIKVDIP